jgi:DNA-directed RNA polymerase beta subunit
MFININITNQIANKIGKKKLDRLKCFSKSNLFSTCQTLKLKNNCSKRKIKKAVSQVYCPFLDFQIPNFLDIQRSSFKTFLKNGLIEELDNLKKITNSNNKLELLFYPKKYKLLPPKWTPKQTILKRKTYACALFIPVQLTNYKTNQIILKWFLLCNLPLMTKNGHFIINGSPKIIMNQIVRSPGVYFQKIIKSDKQIIYSADFIAQRGTWLRLEMDNKKREIWAKLKKTPKLPVFVFLRCFGLSIAILNNYLNFYCFVSKNQKDFNFMDLMELLHQAKLLRQPQLLRQAQFLPLLPLLPEAPLLRQAQKQRKQGQAPKQGETQKQGKQGKQGKQRKQESDLLKKKRKRKSQDEFNLFLTQNQNFFELYNKLYPKSQESFIDFKKIGKHFLYKKFLNPRLYNLSTLGRARINQKLGLTIPIDHTVLTAKDILFACFYLIECQKGTQNPTDIDDLKNRKIRPSGELIQNQFAIGLFRFEKTVREKLILNEKGQKPFFNSNNNKVYQQINNKTLFTFFDTNNTYFDTFYFNSKNNKQAKTKGQINEKDNISRSFLILNNQLNDFLNSKAIQNSLREFFGTNPLCQLLDQTNPLAEITHKRRLSSLGFGGINRDTAGMAIRGIHPTHYGRICPIETPEGQNAGLVNSFTIYSQLNKRGFIETPFYQTYKGFILQKKPYFFSSDQEKELNLGPGDIKKNKLNFLPKKNSIPCRQLKEFKRLFRNEIDFIGVSPVQMISIATSLIPFLEHDDGNRALMGSNMQRQAVPTLKPSLPIVGTGLESKIIADINHGLQIKKAGFVAYVDGKKIIIYSPKTFSANSLSSLSIENPSQTKTELKPFFNTKPVKFNTNRLSFVHKDQNKRVTRKTFQAALTFFQKKKVFSGIFPIKKTNNPVYFSLFSDFNLKKSYVETKLKEKLLLNPFFENKVFGINYFFNQTNKIDLKTNNYFYLFNSTQLFTVFNFGFTNRFLPIWQLINLFSNKSIALNQSKTFKPFLNKKCLQLIRLVYNKNILLNYSKFLLIKGPLFFSLKKSFQLKKTSNSWLLTNYKKQIKHLFIQKEGCPFFFKAFLFSSFMYFPLSGYNSSFLEDRFSLKKFINKKAKGQQKKMNPFCYGLIKSLQSIQKNKPLIPFIITTLQNNELQKKTNFFSNFNNFSVKAKMTDACTGFPLKFRIKKFKPITNDINRVVSFKNYNFYKTNMFKVFKFDWTHIKEPYYLTNFLLTKTISNQHTKKTFEQKVNQDQTVNRDLLFLLALKRLSKEKKGNNQKQIKQTLIHDSKKAISLFSFSQSLIPISYNLDLFYRSNQDTYLSHRPIVEEGQWVEKKDLIADNSASKKGQLALGQNILIAYMPWEGYNFEDAVLMSDHVVSNDLFTTLHIERYEIEVRDTPFGKEQITNKLPDLTQDISYLDYYGIAQLGTWVQPGDVLVGKITPLGQKKLSAYEKLLYDIIGKKSPTVKDSSLRVPLGVHGRVVHVEILDMEQLDLFDFSKLNKEKINHQEPDFSKTKKSSSSIVNKIKKKPKMFLGRKHFQKPFIKINRNKNFILNKKINSDIILSADRLCKPRTVHENPIKRTCSSSFLRHQKIKNISNSISINIINKLNKVKRSNYLTFSLLNETNSKKEKKMNTYDFSNAYEINKKLFPSKKPLKVHIYIAEKRPIQVGDKIAGRHGNKGIISKILPKQDMPYLVDGTPIDVVLNPLGVPSRMNVGQIFECLLGLAGYYLGQHYKIQPFDEIYGCEASRSLVYLKLYEAKIKTGQNWLFNLNFPGKVRLFDGRTGECFDQPVTIGYAYILKLVHLVDEKIHARSTGPYSLVTQQPLRGRSKQGGQRVGEMEVWALEGFGAAYILQELLTIKSDDIKGRNQVSKAILNNKPLKFGIPESFKVLIKELQCLCLDISIYKFNQKGIPIKMTI